MIKKIFLFNPNRCLGCRACQVACAALNKLPGEIFLRRILPVEFVKGNQIVKYFLSSACNHCENPECIRLCPQKTFRKRRDGIVLFDSHKCTGCGTCIRACPFQALVQHPVTGKVVKCDMCHSRQEEGQLPFCVSACMVNALQAVDAAEIAENNNDTVRVLPGVPKIQITRPSIRFVPLAMGRQVHRYPVGNKEEN